MTRWLWIWFFLLLSFPIMPATRLMGRAPAVPRAGPDGDVRTVAAMGLAAPAAPWSGPLARVVDRLEWIDGHRASADDLHGKVVLVEFWTFDCVNCRRTQPAMHALAKRYASTGVRIVSIHTPELAHERDPASVARAVAASGIEYPVALDPEFRAWKAFENRYWPCLYVLDGEGRVRYRHIGELHEGSEGWKDLVRRIDLVSAAGRAAAKAG